MEGAVGIFITESTSIISEQSEANKDLKNCCKIEETEGSASSVVDGENTTISDLENNFLSKPKGKGINLLSDCDDSFEVFLPLKKCSSQKTVESSKQQTGKQKLKKSTRTRACPYFSTKSIKSHFKSPLKSQEDRDLELALARSLLDVSGSSDVIVKTDSSNTLRNLNKKDEKHIKLKNWTGKKDQKKNVKSLLSRRTSHERERIITQKLAIVLLGSKETENNSTYNTKIELSSSLLVEILDKNSSLWEISKVNTIGLNSFYVGALSNFIEPIKASDIDCEMVLHNETAQVASKSWNNSDLSGNDGNSVSIVDSDDEEDSIDFGTKLESLNVFSNDWRGIFGDGELSDVDVLLPSGIFPCHKLVFKARCPAILEDVNELYSPPALDLSHYPAKSADIFLKYIYSGRTDDISGLSKNERKLLSALARKYKVDYLHTLLSTCTESDLFYSQSTCSVPLDCGQNSINEKGKIVLCDSSISSKKVKKSVSQKKNHSEQHFVLDGPPITLTDSSSSSSVKCFSPEKNHSKKNENKSPTENRHFSVFSKQSLSPDLFNDSLLSNVSSRLSELKRKLSVQDDFRRKRVQSTGHDSPNTSKNTEKSLQKAEIVTLDSSPEKSNSPEKNTPVRKLWQGTISSSSVKDVSTNDDNFCDGGFHFNFDINELNEPASHEQCNEKNEYNKTVPLHNNHSLSPPVCLIDDSKDEDSPPKTKKSSLEKYLHTSFPSFLEDIEPIDNQLSTSTPTSTPRPAISKELTVTPDQEVIIKDATPLANYNAMATPELQRELSKYGLKRTLVNEKGRALLSYIYDQTHKDVELNINSKSKKKTLRVPGSKNEQNR